MESVISSCLTLRVTVGHGDSGCVSILVDASAPYDGPDSITIFHGLLQRFQDDDATSFASTKSGASLVKCY